LHSLSARGGVALDAVDAGRLGEILLTKRNRHVEAHVAGDVLDLVELGL